MAEKLGEAILELGTDESRLDRGIASAETKAQDLAKSFSKTGKKLSLFLTMPILGVGAAAIKATADIEMQQAGFETMLGSAEAAQEHLEELRELAAKTPFELSDLADASKTLLAFGLDSEDVLPALRQLGDISMGDADKLGSLTLAFAQIQSTGRLMGQDLLQLINAGFNPLQILGEQTGETMADLKERMSEGGVSAAEIAEAFRIATSEGGRFFGGMERASQTLSGRWSTLKDDAITLAISFGEILLPALHDLITSIRGMFSWLNSLDEGTKKFIMTAAGILAGIGPALLGISGLIKAIMGIKTAVTAVSAVMNMAVAGTPAGIIALAIAALIAATILIITHWEEISGFFQNLWNTIAGIFQTAVDAIKGWLAEHWDELAIILGGPIGAAVVAIIKHWDDIKALFTQAKDFILGVVEALVNGIREFLVGRFQSIVDGLRGAIDKVKGFFQGLYDDVVGKSIVPDLVDGVTDEFARMRDNMGSIVDSAVRTFSSTFASVVGDVIEGSATMWDAFKAGAKEAVAAVLEALAEMAFVKAAAAVAEALLGNVAAWGAAAAFTAAGIAAQVGAVAVRALEFGGLITEPVVGMGLQTGSMYTIAERGPERVTRGGEDESFAVRAPLILEFDGTPFYRGMLEATRNGIALISPRGISNR